MTGAANSGRPAALRDRVPALPERATMLRLTFAAWLRDHGVLADLADGIVLAVYEAMVNAVMHAYADAPGSFELAVVLAGDELTVTVTDFGRWRPQEDPSPRWGGRGLSLIRRLSDEATIVTNGNGTTVRMSWRLSRSQLSDSGSRGESGWCAG